METAVGQRWNRDGENGILNYDKLNMPHERSHEIAKEVRNMRAFNRAEPEAKICIIMKIYG